MKGQSARLIKQCQQLNPSFPISGPIPNLRGVTGEIGKAGSVAAGVDIELSKVVVKKRTRIEGRGFRKGNPTGINISGQS